MSKPAGVTQASIRRAITAATRSGLAVIGIEQLPGGGVRILTDKPGTKPIADNDNPWDRRLGAH